MVLETGGGYMWHRGAVENGDGEWWWRVAV